jgi:hypothetical protein
VPISWMKAETCKCAAICRPPAARRPPPPFIGQGEAVYSHAAWSSTTYGGMAHSVVELMVALEKLASGGCRGKSCACPEALRG